MTLTDSFRLDSSLQIQPPILELAQASFVLTLSEVLGPLTDLKVQGPPFPFCNNQKVQTYLNFLPFLTKGDLQVCIRGMCVHRGGVTKGVGRHFAHVHGHSGKVVCFSDVKH